MNNMSNTATATKPTPATVWTIDPSHSSASFSVRHMMISKVRGEISALQGQIHFDPARPEAATVSATLDLASINTREAKRDEHLKSADFFDVAKYPQIRFESREVARSGDGYTVKGELTIKGVTRPVTLTVEGPTAPHTDPYGNVRIGASATTKIKRSDFGITWNVAIEAGGVLVGDEITIELDVSLIRA
jgi:polyisoprenoid-binding protein YceI